MEARRGGERFSFIFLVKKTVKTAKKKRRRRGGEKGRVRFSFVFFGLLPTQKNSCFFFVWVLVSDGGDLGLLFFGGFYSQAKNPCFCCFVWVLVFGLEIAV